MLAARGMPVTYLRRDAEGGLTLQGLPCGAVRPLTEPEIAALDPVKMTKHSLREKCQCGLRFGICFGYSDKIVAKRHKKAVAF